jgi:hypothetical protein
MELNGLKRKTPHDKEGTAGTQTSYRLAGRPAACLWKRFRGPRLREAIEISVKRQRRSGNRRSLNLNMILSGGKLYTMTSFCRCQSPDAMI